MTTKLSEVNDGTSVHVFSLLVFENSKEFDLWCKHNIKLEPYIVSVRLVKQIYILCLII